jgi:hypothetical protein
MRQSSFEKKQSLGGLGGPREMEILISGAFAMSTSVDFQMVCGSCGGLAIKIENPERAPREAIIYCGDCGVSRGTMGALRDLAVRPDVHPLLPMKQLVPKVNFRSEIVALHKEVLGLRRKVQMEESRRK